MKSILQSIKPQYCGLIAAGKKTIEVRKTRPKLDVPFKVYIYETKGSYITGLNGTVIGEYVCDEIQEFVFDNEYSRSYDISDDDLVLTRLIREELWQYGKGKPLYGWHISDLKLYDKPRKLREFVRYDFALDYDEWEHYAIAGINGKEPDINDYRLIHPPQSWCYVEEVRE